MIVLILAGLLVVLAVYQGKFIRKHNVKIYIGAVLIAIIAFVFEGEIKVLDMFMEGFVGLSILYVVMVTGALKDKSKLKIKLAGIRREYSIIGFILITPHATKYFLEFLSGDIKIPLFGIVGYAIMIPLFVTSFYTIRKKMSRNTWVTIQKLAYGTYFVLFIHLIKNASSTQNLVAYVVLFVGYFIMRIYREIVKSNNKNKK